MIFLVLPLVVIVSASFTATEYLAFPPKGLTLRWYMQFLEDSSYLRSTELVNDPPAGVLAGLMGMVDASVIWWLDHHDESQDQLVHRLSRQVTAVLIDMLGEMGLRVPEETVFEPRD